jgi:hypothetical protein
VYILGNYGIKDTKGDFVGFGKVVNDVGALKECGTFPQST